MRRIALLSLLLTGCVGSAVPQPPNLDPIDPGKVVYDGSEDAGSFLVLIGRPGAAPAGAELWVWNLEDAEPPITTAIDADGGFIAVVPAAHPEALVRLQARSGENRSAPIDLVAGVSSSTVLEHPECLEVAPELVLADRSSDLLIDNGCAEEATLGETRLRMTEDFAIGRPDALRLPPNTRATLRIESDVASEDIVFVNLALGEGSFLYPVTLIAPAL